MNACILRLLVIYFLFLPIQVFASSKNVAEVYEKQCATCHGNKGDGRGRVGASLDPRPTNFTDPVVIASLSREKIVTIIKNGVSGTSMVGYARRFDDQTIDQLASFIQTRFMGIRSADFVIEKSPGQILYAEHCSACHGDNGNSAVWAKNGLNPPPRNFTSDASKAELSRERMISSITYGRPGTAMMSFAKRLTSNEIEAIVNYIRSDFMKIQASKDAKEIESLPSQAIQPDNLLLATDSQMGLAFPNKLKGDVAKGKQFYEANCFVCHGKKGDGAGPRAKFNRPPPRNFTAASSQRELNRPRLFTAISKGKRGTVMPAWSTVLNEQQIANVAEYVFQTFIQPQKKK